MIDDFNKGQLLYFVSFNAQAVDTEVDEICLITPFDGLLKTVQDNENHNSFYLFSFIIASPH